MGGNMARRMLDQGWRVTGFNRSPEVVKKMENEGLIPAFSLKEMTNQFTDRKIVWLMLPAGNTIDEILFGSEGLLKFLRKGDVVIDGGNSFYKDTIERERKLAKHGISFIDCGISGGPDGARYGASLMIGGKRKDFKELEAMFRDLALPGGYEFFEGVGAGHFVKMIHNGIEYGMMQAIAEGFTILKESRYKLDLSRICDVYNHGSVIESRLIEWMKKAFELHGVDLKSVTGSIGQSGEGKWTVETASEMNIAVKVIHEALLFRQRSEKKPNYTGQIVSALREQFGGHQV
jgi:6-phosphogluconate dehydrogenase